MPAKRKRTTNSSEISTPRRSRRARNSSTKANEDHVSKDHRRTEVEGLLIGPGFEVAERDPKEQDESGVRPEEGVDHVLRELAELDKTFHDATKRQRLAIEESNLGLSSGSLTDAKENRRLELSPVEPVEPAKPFGGMSAVNKASVEQPPLDEYAEAHATDGKEDTNLAGGRLRKRPRKSKGGRSDSLPLPWMGRLGYACLNTYLRNATPTVFCSRTCRVASILDHRHPLQDPSQPEHPVKNRPDTSKPADISRGQKYVEELGLANARDIVKMLRWNDKYGIKFMRLSSEMFPFASHAEYGYKLAPFASEVLAEAGKVAAELGHRLTTHPGQFTQLGTPRDAVVTSSVRDLEYHDEMLSLLRLPEQMDRDAVMIIHMGGTFGDKEATLDRFRTNYAKLSDGVKRRLVLENDDVSWSVHDLLPICEELNIPLVLDYHHHNIVSDPCTQDGTFHITDLDSRIRATWTKKKIRQKMHYSEPTDAAVTPRERRKHSARVKSLPPCPPDMDLMIEAKDKEQAVFELMRTFRLPGCERFHDMLPHERDDEPKKEVKKKAKKSKKKNSDDEEESDTVVSEKIVSAEDTSMGGPQNRVYWPEGKEDWLRPKKRDRKTTDQVVVPEDSC